MLQRASGGAGAKVPAAQVRTCPGSACCKVTVCSANVQPPEDAVNIWAPLRAHKFPALGTVLKALDDEALFGRSRSHTTDLAYCLCRPRRVEDTFIISRVERRKF